METGSDTSDKASPAPERDPSAATGLDDLDAVLFDLDGVVTETATVHAEAWRKMFDGYLRERSARLGGQYRPFDPDRDYRQYVDGKPRFDGVASFLESRCISLPQGRDSDAPECETICGLGNRKNELFLEAIREHGVTVFQTSVDFIQHVKAQGMRVAVVTASRNCNEILDAAGIESLFDAQVDGSVAREWMLQGKPAPDTFLEAARRLGVPPQRAAVIEDAAAGVQAGKAGHFALVVGVSRDGNSELLEESGADIVVSDLKELDFRMSDNATETAAPLALDEVAQIRARIEGRRVAIFLDYDGTLTPIVERPDLAVLSGEMRETLKALADRCTVVVVSGRERSNVERLVGLDGIYYAGSHGFDISGPAGTSIRHEEGAGYVPVIEQAAHELERRLAPIDGIIVENKIYALAVHYRMVKDQDYGRVAHIVDDVLAQHPLLRKTTGKKVFEFRPRINWDKGRAVLWLLDALGLGGADVIPVYIGDDETDHDAFRALHGKGISLLVADEPQSSSADYRLTDTDEVRRFLSGLTSMLGGTDE